MCFMDWRIGRLIRAVNHKQAGGVGSSVEVPANQQRVGLTVWGNGAGDAMQLLPGGQTPLIGAPVAAVQQIPLHITIATHGDMPMRALTIVQLTGVQNEYYWTEYFAPEKVLQLGLEQIQNQYPI